MLQHNVRITNPTPSLQLGFACCSHTTDLRISPTRTTHHHADASTAAACTHSFVRWSWENQPDLYVALRLRVSSRSPVSYKPLYSLLGWWTLDNILAADKRSYARNVEDDVMSGCGH